MKILIVDDELNSRRIIRKFITDAFPEFILSKDACDVPEAIELISSEKPDIILLDIQLNNKLSFEILENVKLNNQHVIFISAYSQYALKAFEVNASNYLLKPIKKEKLIFAITKTCELISIKGRSKLNKSFEKLLIPSSGAAQLIDISTLKYIEADGVYCRLNTTNGVTLVTKPLGYFEEKLNGHNHFYRIHKSYLVNINFIESIGNDGKTVTLEKSILIPISRSKKREVNDIIKALFY